MAKNIGATLSLKDGNFFANIKKADTASDKFRKTLSGSISKLDSFGKAAVRVKSPLSSLTNGIKGFIGAYAGIEGLKGLGSLADDMASTKARLDQINDGMQTNAELNAMIYQSAKASRGQYKSTADLVTKLGNNCGTVFESTKETVTFAEQLNKRFVIAGASAGEASSAITQLAQGLAAGALRGEELNSVLENAPNIARTIEQYMGIAQGSIKSAAEDGLVTADVVKNAILSTVDETNAKFNEMPLTFGQIWQNMKTSALQHSEPILSKINEIANGEKFQGLVTKTLEAMDKLTASGAIDSFANNMVSALDKGMGLIATIADNWNLLKPVIEGAATAMLVYKGATVMAAAVIKVMTGVQMLLNGAMLANPIGLIIAGVALLVGAFVLLWNKCEGFRKFWIKLWDGMRKVGSAAWNGIKKVTGTVLDAMKKTVSEKLGNIKNAYEKHGGGIKGVAAGAWEAIKGYYTAGFTFVDNLTGGKLTAVKDKFVNAFNSIKDKIKNVFESIGKTISSIWDKIKGMVKTPSIVQTGTVEVLGFDTKIPKWGIEWHADGGIMTRPTVFAYSGATAHVGGESGAEAILPLSQFWRNLERFTRESSAGGSTVNHNNFYVTVHAENENDEAVARRLAAQIRRRLENM